LKNIFSRPWRRNARDTEDNPPAHTETKDWRQRNDDQR
jgi:hypothetical protein